MTPAPPIIEEQIAASLSNAGITVDADDDRPITGVRGQITGVDDVSFPVTPSTTQEAHVNQKITPSTMRETHVVQRITPPRLLRQQVEVEDVDSGDEDEGEQRESDTAPPR